MKKPARIGMYLYNATPAADIPRNDARLENGIYGLLSSTHPTLDLGPSLKRFSSACYLVGALKVCPFWDLAKHVPSISGNDTYRENSLARVNTLHTQCDLSLFDANIARADLAQERP